MHIDMQIYYQVTQGGAVIEETEQGGRAVELEFKYEECLVAGLDLAVRTMKKKVRTARPYCRQRLLDSNALLQDKIMLHIEPHCGYSCAQHQKLADAGTTVDLSQVQYVHRCAGGATV